MSTVLFFDPCCLRPYDSDSLRAEAMGGTESTLTRVADALGALVAQHNRTLSRGRYLRPEPLPEVTHVIVSREARALEQARTLYPRARVILWLHDRMHPSSKRGRRLAASAPLLRELNVEVVCVSDSQRQGVEATLQRIGADGVGARTIYNPVDPTLIPDGSPIEPHKLVFFSSPNKGLYFALDAFRALRRAMPDLRLVVGNPGYKSGAVGRVPGVEYLGPVPQGRMHAEVRTALCTFFPNFLIPETFGLVFAESHALGTPVLTHDCGAAREVVADPGQLLPVTLPKRSYEAVVGALPRRWRAGPARVAALHGLFEDYIARIRAWRAGARPSCGPDPRFALGAITEQWRRLLK